MVSQRPGGSAGPLVAVPTRQAFTAAGTAAAAATAVGAALVVA